MNLRIESLSPSNKHDLTRLLEGADFEHAPEWKTCYCRYYHTACSFADWIKRSAAVNKADTLEEIDRGTMKGFLAYDGDRVIGWVNANDLSRYPRLESIWADLPKKQKIGLTICYVVDPAYRGQGVAGKLLDQALVSFEQDAYDMMIALPFEDLREERMYRGRVSMYLKRGYVRKKEQDGILLLVKELHAWKGDVT